jgi:protein tyrosine phosphatase (PTP) superfamily phosphohydrolase (DUF442 family)
MWRRLLLAGMASGVLASQTGCRNCCKRRSVSDDAGLPPPPGGFLGPPSTPSLDDRIPPPALPTTPGGGDRLPPPPVIPDNSNRTFRVDPAYPPPGPPLPAGVAPAGVRPSIPPPPAALPTTPAPSRAQRPPRELLLPDDAGPTRSPPPKYLDEPIRPAEPAKPADPPPAANATDLPPPPAAAPNRSLPPPPASVSERPPVGLTGYMAVAGKPGVYAGRKPALDGFDALKSAGFKTVVYVHDPDADVGPARDLAAKRGLTFVPVPVSPETLGRAASAFNAAVTAPDGRPTYVCDDDGVRAGALWYVHFRTVDLLNDDVARVRAAGLGYTEGGAEGQKFAAAAREYLANR